LKKGLVFIKEKFYSFIVNRYFVGRF